LACALRNASQPLRAIATSWPYSRRSMAMLVVGSSFACSWSDVTGFRGAEGGYSRSICQCRPSVRQAPLSLCSWWCRASWFWSSMLVTFERASKERARFRELTIVWTFSRQDHECRCYFCLLDSLAMPPKLVRSRSSNG
jgi:hypothetical protein